MDISILDTPIHGCYRIMLPEQKDYRGTFIKLFHADTFHKRGLETNFPEEYYSTSRKGVLRGMHFQIPPRQHVKLVYCLDGTIWDAFVDLRKNSPTYQRYAAFELKAPDACLLYLAPGVAHGYAVTSESATILYKVSTVYSPVHDCGIRWDSTDIPWPISSPILSARDGNFPAMQDYDSPFYDAEAGKRS